MKRRSFLIAGLSVTAAASAGAPVLARALHERVSISKASVRRYRRAGNTPGSCANHGRRASPHAGFTLEEALSGVFS